MVAYHEYLKTNTMGYIDTLGNFVLHLNGSHVDPYKEDSLGFFKKITYYDKLKELNDSHLQAMHTLRDIADPEQQKFELYQIYVGAV